MRFLLVSEVADRLNASPSLVYELMRIGRLPYVRIGTSKQGGKRIKEDDLERFIEENRIEGADDPLPQGLKYIKMR